MRERCERRGGRLKGYIAVAQGMPLRYVCQVVAVNIVILETQAVVILASNSMVSELFDNGPDNRA